MQFRQFGFASEKKNGQTLQVFYAAKTQKPEVLFRAIVSKQDSLQFMPSSFLQKMLATLNVNDPFSVSNSEEVVQYVSGLKEGKYTGFSVDIQYLYYSLPQDGILQSVRACIEEDNDEVSFRNKCGMSVDAFLEVLSLYLGSTYVLFKNKVYIQKEGVCIGSKVAPV